MTIPWSEDCVKEPPRKVEKENHLFSVWPWPPPVLLFEIITRYCYSNDSQRRPSVIFQQKIREKGCRNIPSSHHAQQRKNRRIQTEQPGTTISHGLTPGPYLYDLAQTIHCPETNKRTLQVNIFDNSDISIRNTTGLFVLLRIGIRSWDLAAMYDC